MAEVPRLAKDPSKLLTRSQCLEEALNRIERKYPQFCQPGYRPPPDSDEASEFKEYEAMKNSKNVEFYRHMLPRFLQTKAREDAVADSVLARMDLAPIKVRPKHPSTEGQEDVGPHSLKEERGKTCEQVVREIQRLRKEITRTRTGWTFAALRADYPDLIVLEMLSAPPFDDEDRHLISHPNQWEVRYVTYATGILKKYFEVGSDETIRSYRKAYKARPRISPPPLTTADRPKQRSRPRKS